MPGENFVFVLLLFGDHGQDKDDFAYWYKLQILEEYDGRSTPCKNLTKLIENEGKRSVSYKEKEAEWKKLDRKA